MQEAVLTDIDNQIENQELKIRRKEGEIEELQKKIATLEKRDTSAQVRALYCGRPHRVCRVPYFVAHAALPRECAGGGAEAEYYGAELGA